jgi:protein-disulfide isomerase
MSDTITLKKDTLWKASTVILAIVVIWMVTSGGDSNSNAINNPPTVGNLPSAPVVADMDELVDDDAFKGDANAPVTIVEWSDYECPFCARFYDQTLAQLDEEYIKTGKVKFVYRDFPLGFHQQAQKAAEAAECAGEQGKYFDMHDALFENGVAGGVSSFKQFASDIGLDTGDFDECLDSGEMASEVAEDLAAGSAAGVTGTPGFIINGQLVSGAQPFSVFKQVIDAALAA